MSKLLSVVVSVYNEEESIRAFYDRTTEILKTIPEEWDYEMLFINDGSSDGSGEVLRALADSDERVKVVTFSRNFGHEAAMTAGIDYTKGDGIICMDADLQHPPEEIPKIIEKFDEGYEVIMMVRLKNKSAGLIKNITSSGFYWLINKLSDVRLEPNASDFFAIGKKAAHVLRSDYRECVRFLRGFVQSIGFKTTTIEYEAGERIAGKSKYSLKKLFRFSIDTLLCFSDAPLRLGMYSAAAALLIGVVTAAFTIYTRVRYGVTDGYAAIAVLICFMFAVLFFIVGIMGEYIGILFKEVKDRPVYIVEDTVNMEDTDLFERKDDENMRKFTI